MNPGNKETPGNDSSDRSAGGRPAGRNSSNGATVAIEERLRRQLPLLADALAATPGSESAPGSESIPGVQPASGIRPIDGSGRVEVVTKRRRPWLAAAATVLVLGLGGVALWTATGDDNDQLETVDRSDETAPDPDAVDDGEPDNAAFDADDGGSADRVQVPVGFGTWQPMAGAPIPSRSYAAAYWDGDEAVFWAGTNADRTFAFTDGAAYHPATDTWRSVRSPGWGHPGLSASAVGERLVVVAKGGASLVDLTSGESVDVPKPDDGNGGDLLYAGAVAGDETVYLVGARSTGAEMNGIVIVGYDSDDDRVWTVYEDPNVPVGWESLAFPAVQTLWTGDEVVVWTAAGSGLAVDPVVGEGRRLPTLRTGLAAVVDSRLVMTGRGPVAVAHLDDSGTSAVRLARLVGRNWSWSQALLTIDDFDTASVVGAGDWVVMVSSSEAPLVWHVPSGRWFRDDEGPMAAAVNLVWTGDRVVAWGGDLGDGSATWSAMIWSPPPDRAVEGAGAASAVPSDSGLAVFDFRFDSGDRFRLALPPRFAEERFDVVQQPADGVPAIATSRSMRVTIDYEPCGDVPGAANALGSQVEIQDDMVVLCRQNGTLRTTIGWLDRSGRRTGEDVELANFDLRPMAIGSTYRGALVETWPELADCPTCHLPAGPYLGDGDVVITVNGPTTVEAVHPTDLKTLWSFDPGGASTTLHRLIDGVGVAAEGGDFLSVETWLGTVQWRIERDPAERSTMVSNHGEDRFGFGLLRTSFDVDGDDRPPLLRRFNQSTGRVAWTAQLAENTSWHRTEPVVIGDLVVAAGVVDEGDSPGDTVLAAYDLDSGERQWSTVLDDLPAEMSRLSVDDAETVVVLETTSATTLTLDPDTGEISES
jgi:hypothetical protein